MKNKILFSILMLALAAPSVAKAKPKIWLTATPDPLIMDPQAKKRPLAKISVHVLNAGKAKIELVALKTNIGEISKHKAAKTGGWFAAYRPPKLAFPTVALIHADLKVNGKRVRRWVALGVAIRLRLPVAVKGAVDISVSTGGKDFQGPTPKKRQKQVIVPIVITPGAGNYTINRTTERGVTSAETQRFDLPPFPRMVILGPKKPAAGSMIRVDVFHVGAKGKEYTYNVPLIVECSDGEIKESRGLKSVQTFWIKLTGETGESKIKVYVKQEPKVIGWHHMNIELSKTRKLKVTVDPKELRMTSPRSVKVLVKVTDPFDNVARIDKLSVTANGKPITTMARLETGLWRGWVYAPNKRQPKDRLVIKATAHRAHGSSAVIKLLGGQARKLTIAVLSKPIQADGKRGVKVRITAVDAMGMAPQDRSIEVTSTQGKIAYLHRARPGLFLGLFVPKRIPGGGVVRISAQTTRASAVTTKFKVLPIPQRFMLSTSLGAFSDLGSTLGIHAGLRFEYAAYKGKPNVHIGFEVLLSPHLAAKADQEQDEYVGFSAGAVFLTRLRFFRASRFVLDGLVDVGGLGVFSHFKTYNAPSIDTHDKGGFAFTIGFGLEAGLVTVGQNELFFLLRFRWLTSSLRDVESENHLTILGGIGYRFEL